MGGYRFSVLERIIFAALLHRQYDRYETALRLQSTFFIITFCALGETNQRILLHVEISFTGWLNYESRSYKRDG